MKTLPGKEIACEYDSLGPIKVFDDGNKRYLTFGTGDEQSCVIKTNPSLLQYDYNRAMALVLLFCQPKKVGVLGLGGGSLVHCLFKLLPNAHFEVVELRQAVIKTAYKYFYLPHHSRLNVTCADAISYLADLPAGCWQTLFSDLYIPEGLEARQLTARFLTEAVRVLPTEGYLVVNALEEYRTNQVLSGLFSQYFASVFECITKDGNWVVIATNCEQAKQIDSGKIKMMSVAAKVWSESLGFNLCRPLKQLSRVL